tara:strand:- start:712 stop:1239 length:528 start_codon:yes stop_codon:yes gene_type:complete
MRAEDSIITEKNSKTNPLLDIENQLHNDDEDTQYDHKIIQTYQYSKTIKIYTCLDTLINAFYVFFNPWYIIPTLLSVVGYFGALEYNNILLIIYCIYQISMIIIRLALNINYLITHTFTIGPLITMFVLTSILTILDLLITRFIIRMVKHIKQFTKDDIQKLKTIKEIKTNFVYF